MQSFVGGADGSVKVVPPRGEIIGAGGVILGRDISAADIEEIGFLGQLYQPFQLVLFSQKCLDLWHLVKTGHIIDVTDFTIQSAADGVALHRHDLVNEGALNVQCIDLHRSQFKPGNVIGKPAAL